MISYCCLIAVSLLSNAAMHFIFSIASVKTPRTASQAGPRPTCQLHQRQSARGHKRGHPLPAAGLGGEARGGRAGAAGLGAK